MVCLIGKTFRTRKNMEVTKSNEGDERCLSDIHARQRTQMKHPSRIQRNTEDVLHRQRTAVFTIRREEAHGL